MKTKDGMFHQRCEGEVIKEVRKELPNIGRTILTNTFIVKTIHLANVGAFVISSQNCKPVSKSALQYNQQGHSFNRIVTSVHIVPHKQVICVRQFASNAKQLL